MPEALPKAHRKYCFSISRDLLRRARRYVNSLVEGVPPSEWGKLAKHANWNDQCWLVGQYEQGRVFHEKSVLRFEELNEEMRLIVNEDY